GERSDWSALERYIAWVVEVRGMCVRHHLPVETLAVATTPHPDLAHVAALDEANSSLTALRRTLEWPADYLASTPMADAAIRLRAMSQSVGDATHWATFEEMRQHVAASPAAELLTIAMQSSGAETDVPFAVLPRMF